MAAEEMSSKVAWRAAIIPVGRGNRLRRFKLTPPKNTYCTSLFLKETKRYTGTDVFSSTKDRVLLFSTKQELDVTTTAKRFRGGGGKTNTFWLQGHFLFLVFALRD